MPTPRPADRELTAVEPRDYMAEMNTILEAETADVVYSAPIVASRVAAMLRATDPDLLRGWLDLGAEGFIHQAIGTRDRARRARARVAQPRNEFALAAERFGQGDASALASWLEVRFVVEHGRRKPLGRMTARDLSYVAGGYEARVKANRLEAAWLRAIANKIGDGIVADFFTDQQLHDMRVSLTPG
jgi:hypothetical protein